MHKLGLIIPLLLIVSTLLIGLLIPRGLSPVTGNAQARAHPAARVDRDPLTPQIKPHPREGGRAEGGGP